MNNQQYAQFNSEKLQLKIISLDDLTDKSPRTLLYGYDKTRATLHVYIDPLDGLIHVLKYASTGSADEEGFLVLSHTSGQSGGVERNEQFVRDMHLHPESCDLEFCQVLRSWEIPVLFTTFEDSAAMARTARFNGFAGYVATANALKGVDVAQHIEGRRLDFGTVKVKCQLMSEACLDVDVPFAALANVVYVAERDVSKVVERVVMYQKTLSRAAYRDSKTVFEEIFEEAIVARGMSVAEDTFLERFGTYTAGFLHFSKSRLANYAPDTMHYEGPSDVTALLGTYADRPYLVVLKKGNHSTIHLNLFGDEGRFVAEMLQHYQLVRVASPQ